MESWHTGLKAEDITWLGALPKVELHLHLEGAIPLETLRTLIGKYREASEVPSLENLRQRFVYRDFPHFIRTWLWKSQFLREYEDMTLVAESVARDLATQNIRYAEVFFSPADFRRHGLEVQPLTEAIRRGLSRVPEIEIALIADLVRDFEPSVAAGVLERLVECRALGIIGVGLGGSEQEFPPELFQEVFHRARQLGFRCTAHAGEAAGAESVWGAIRALEAERIGHGARAVEDPTLVDFLASSQIPLEMCPISNLRTGVVKSLEEHPIRHFLEQGLVVTVNTDDPKMFGNSLVDEFAVLMSNFGLSRAEICGLIQAAISTSWLDETRKKRLKAEFSRHSAWVE